MSHQPAGSDAAASGQPPASDPVSATPPLEPDVEPGYDDTGVPTFESVREKIETRYAASLGAAELAAETPEAQAVEERYAARQRAAAERLAQIRESMHHDDRLRDDT